MARLWIRLAAGAALAVSFAISTLPCKAQANSRNAAPATRAEWADDDIDPQDIVVPASSRGIAVQSEADEQAEQAILAALARPISVDFSDTPLREVRRAIQSQMGVNILIDAKDLVDAGVNDDTRITFSANYLSARTVLRQILSQKELNWLIAGGAIVITTDDVAKTRTEVRVYPIADLALGVDGNGNYTYDFDSLIELITSTVAPSSWDSNGGAGSVAPYGASGALVFSQTREIHDQVAMLLDKLRLVRHMQGLDAGLRIARDQLQLSAGGARAEQETLAEPQPDYNAALLPSANLSIAQPGWRKPHVYH